MTDAGYPIWHGQAPRIVSTFLESYDFTGKTIVPFCTSHSSGIGSSDTNLHPLASSADWLSGRRFASGTSLEMMTEWIDSLDLPKKEPAPVDSAAFNFETKTVMLNSGYAMPINGIGTYSLLNEVCVTSVSEALNRGVRLIDTAYMYSNEAEVGEAVRNSGIPRGEIFVTTKLYPNQYKDAASAIDEALEKLDIGYIDLMLLYHPGAYDVEAYHAMEQAVADGKIRSIGLSNWYIEELEEFLPQATITPALVQNEIPPFIDGNGRTGRLLVNLELMKAEYPPIDIKFADRISYYNAFDEYHEKHNLGAMEKLFAEYVSKRLDSCLVMLDMQ